MTHEELGTQIEDLTSKAQTLAQRLESDPSPENVKAMQGELSDVKAQLAPLVEQRENVLRDEAINSMKGQITTLENALTDLRKPSGFEFSTRGDLRVTSEDPYADGGSIFADVRAANKGNTQSLSRLAKAAGLNETEVKAMTEGTDAQGGYLVPNQRLDQVLEDRSVVPANLLGIFPTLQVISDTIEIATVTSGMTAGWVAELATKPAADLSFGQITASVFTAAGLAVVSNQLLRDSRANGRSVDNYFLRDLRRKLDRLFELAIINGSGTGQPRGLLQTAGVQSSATDANLAVASWSVDNVLNALISALMDLENASFNATHIIMHPRRWAALSKFRTTDAKEVILNGANPQSGLPSRTLYGVPVITNSQIPVNLGAGTNEDRIIVIDASEQLVLQNQGITLDESPHVYFTSNQTVFRMEQRVGFTAGRYPQSIAVISGAGLV
jgi:HK97 family phage major capsid protein